MTIPELEKALGQKFPEFDGSAGYFADKISWYDKAIKYLSSELEKDKAIIAKLKDIVKREYINKEIAMIRAFYPHVGNTEERSLNMWQSSDLKKEIESLEGE